MARPCVKSGILTFLQLLILRFDIAKVVFSTFFSRTLLAKTSVKKIIKKGPSQIPHVLCAQTDMRPTTFSTKSTKWHFWEPSGDLAFSTSFLVPFWSSFWRSWEVIFVAFSVKVDLGEVQIHFFFLKMLIFGALGLTFHRFVFVHVTTSTLKL